jgi:hypothetical protein
MSCDQIIASLGVPTTGAHVGPKEIDPCMNRKVIFINCKVADVQ